MKYYTICYPNEHNETVWETLSEEEILDNYWNYWYNAMCAKYGVDHVNNNFTKQDCIDDWCVVHWAERNHWREMKENYE